MLKDITPKARTGGVRRARRLRGEMSLPEILLWQHLRARPRGIKFRRQHPTGPCILDFYCSDARLAVEVDGRTHDGRERQERDAARDAWLIQRSIVTLRITAAEVLRDPHAAAEAILSEAIARLPLHHPASPNGPPPRAQLGEDH